MAETKYLDYEGLECLVSQLKNYINKHSGGEGITAVFDEDTLKFSILGDAYYKDQKLYIR